MPLEASHNLPVIEGSEQPLTTDFLGPSPVAMFSGAPNYYTMNVGQNAGVIAGTVATAFTGPVANVNA
ncbi:hypothetical protein RRF57_010045 [Xylaria bambusicola]|uniref:Uncharacterized protein n=1 Tax=Xylaria bambusicola TaxID=326684 RepID=A0AAN7UXQ1_9PEZI